MTRKTSGGACRSRGQWQPGVGPRHGCAGSSTDPAGIPGSGRRRQRRRPAKAAAAAAARNTVAQPRTESAAAGVVNPVAPPCRKPASAAGTKPRFLVHRARPTVGGI
ncbi:hypothetical protein HPB50_027427 [Hyalomma asiaticum]|uniref:Uncharacterized protein n=1 Tax=Hyalomma asiaticum TaxID=266040 RepID=A0ACB7SL80_HYAAI|nr:hypothetical protein HPB50_027427 [Hyalomma asiaticum]